MKYLLILLVLVLGSCVQSTPPHEFPIPKSESYLWKDPKGLNNVWDGKQGYWKIYKPIGKDKRVYFFFPSSKIYRNDLGKVVTPEVVYGPEERVK